MPEYFTPGVYVEEQPTVRPMAAVGTTTWGVVGVAPDPQAHLGEAYPVNSWAQFLREFVGDGTSTDLAHAVHGFFLNGGSRCYVVNLGSKGKSLTGTGRSKAGLDLLEPIDVIASVSAPGFTEAGHHEQLIIHAETMKDRVAILDPPCDVDDVTALTRVATTGGSSDGGGSSEGGGSPGQAASGLRPRNAEDGYATLYFPCIQVQDPLGTDLVTVPPSGHIAGVWARNDGTRGPHAAPANTPVRGALGLAYHVTDGEHGELNTAGINAIRFFTAAGIRVWGARTLAEPDSPYRYVSTRRFVNMLRESIIEGSRWVVFEPNGPDLWRAVQRDISAFLTRVWRDGALFGRTPEEAFFVRCDESTNPPEERDAGRLICEIGVAVLRPAEFVIFRLTQAADLSQIESLGGTRV
jgi:phage tail sheath protein FI